MKRTPVYKIKVPEYHFKEKPDFKLIGEKIDEVIKKYFLGENIVVRCIGSEEHKGKSVDDLIEIIKKLGTDRYNPKRKGDRYENIDCKPIDIFALDFKVKENTRIMAKFIEPFYTYPIQDGRKPIKLDLVIIYVRNKFKRVLHTYDGKRIKRDGFCFRDPENKPRALKGFIKIL